MNTKVRSGFNAAANGAAVGVIMIAACWAIMWLMRPF
jgi:hypothetical protein